MIGEADVAGEGLEEAAAALTRLEQAMDRIVQTAHARPSDDQPGAIPPVVIAARLDALITRLRAVLAERAGQD